MKFGCCADKSKAKVLKEIGYDYIELGVSTDLNPLNNDVSPIPAIETSLLDAGLPVEAFNQLLPAVLKVTGPNRDPKALRDYIKVASVRAAALGGDLLVFGSGAARMVPDGYDKELAAEEIVEFLQSVADIVKESGLVIAIEPLQKSECNIINSVAEGIDFVRKVNRPDAVAVLSDLYHVTSDGQSFSETADAGKLLKHVHVAHGTDRHPCRWDDLSELTDFFAALKAAGYDSRVSIEANWTDFESSAATGLKVLQKAWSEA